MSGPVQRGPGGFFPTRRTGIRLSGTTIPAACGQGRSGRETPLQRFASRHPIRGLVIAILVAVLVWLIFAPWSDALDVALGKKKIFLNAVFGGVTLGALHFLVSAGFTLIFGLRRNVNLAHGSLYLLGGYIGFEVSERTGSWLLAFPVVFVVVGALGLILQHHVFRRMEGQDCARPW